MAAVVVKGTSFGTFFFPAIENGIGLVELNVDALYAYCTGQTRLKHFVAEAPGSELHVHIGGDTQVSHRFHFPALLVAQLSVIADNATRCPHIGQQQNPGNEQAHSKQCHAQPRFSLTGG